ncbi:hypothetical protein DY000_02008787 [Brassica cretica]|uniref:Alpha/beta hydrolase fold-3 domain-containing protein n=1 Tax=Brassica cretica TaxID=69181 RepID=A0ABQ7BVP7_BRACR|nr:hypothetical protein DY000_02008787 [Brassica cretica]
MVRPPLFLTFTSATEHTHKKTHPSSNVSEHLPFIRIYKDGRVERLTGTEIISTSLDKTNDIVTKDVLYSPEHNISARLFLPHKATAGKNLPLLVYIHGGAWIIESPFSPIYHNYVTEIVKSANCLVVSIQYRRAPEDPVPASYEDSCITHITEGLPCAEDYRGTNELSGETELASRTIIGDEIFSIIVASVGADCVSANGDEVKKELEPVAKCTLKQVPKSAQLSSSRASSAEIKLDSAFSAGNTK